MSRSKENTVSALVNNIRRRCSIIGNHHRTTTTTTALKEKNAVIIRCELCGKQTDKSENGSCSCGFMRPPTKTQEVNSDDEESEEEEEESSYTVIDGLGQGGFATVVKVVENKSRKNYAMKVVPKSRLKSQRQRDQLVAEVSVMEELTSPFLVKCHDSFETDQNIFLILDFIGGGDLFFHLNQMNECLSTSALRKNGGGYSDGKKQLGIITPPAAEQEEGISGRIVGLNESTAKFILAELYLAIEHLHAKGYLHCDIKIENVMLDHAGHVKLIDFGFVTKLEGQGSIVQRDGQGAATAAAIDDKVQPLHASGSLVCLSPELISERTGGRHSDWWAYGVVAYELLTGLSPWSSISDKQIICDEILNVDIVYPNYLSREARQMLMLLLCKKYQDRLCFEQDDEMKSIKFFKTINWKRLELLQCSPPFVPGSTLSNSPEERYAALNAYKELARDS